MGRSLRIETQPIALRLAVIMLSGFGLLFLYACGKSEMKDDLSLIMERLSASGETNAAPWMPELERGFAAYDARDVVTAAQFLSAAHARGCTDPLLLYRLAVVLEKQGESGEAASMYLKLEPDLAALYPEHPFRSGLFINLGNIEYRAERFLSAFTMYEKALLAVNSGAGGSKSEIYYSMGMALLRLERYAEAANWMEKADKNDFRVNYYLASVYKELHKHDLAMQRMRRAVQVEPNSSRALGSLAHFYYALSDREEQEMRFDAAGTAIEQAIVFYRRAVAAGGDIYQENLQAAEWRVNDLKRLQAAAKQGLIQRQSVEEEDLSDPGIPPPEIPKSFFDANP